MPADIELCEYLEDESVGTVGTDLFAGTLPAGVVNGMSLVIYPGAEPELTCGSNGWNLERPRLQFLVRNTNEATALAKARDAAAAFSRIGRKTIEGTVYRAVTVLQTPGLLFRDENDRPNYGFNIEAEKVPS
jgi:hypothetical protein